MENMTELLKGCTIQAVMACDDAQLLDFVYRLLLNG